MIELQFEIIGKGRTVVLVPGGLTGWASWLPIAELLAPSRRVVRVQLLSVQLGLEGKLLPKGYSPKTEADALGASLNSMGLQPPLDFAGWSYGGGVLTDFLLDHPEWARTVTLIEPEVPWVRSELDSWSTMVHYRQSLRAIPTIWENQGDPSRLSRLTAPCLLIKGTGLTPNDHAIVDNLGRELPNARVVELPGGHSAHLVSTDAFLEHMTELQENI